MKRKLLTATAILFAVLHLSAMPYPGKKVDLQFDSEFSEFKSVSCHKITPDDFYNFYMDVSHHFESFCEENNVKPEDIPTLIKSGKLTESEMQLWGFEPTIFINKNSKYNGSYKYNIPKFADCISGANNAPTGGGYSILLASDTEILELYVAPKFSFTEIAPSLPQLFIYKEMGFDGPGYYWKDSTRSMKAFLELFGAKDKSLPKQVTDFQAQFEKFVEEFDIVE